MNSHWLLLACMAIGIQSVISADDEQYNTIDKSNTNIQSPEKILPEFSLSEQGKRSPGRQNPASRQAAFGKRLDGINGALEFYQRWVRGAWPPPGSSSTAFGKRGEPEKGKRRKYGVPSSRLAYFGKREDEKDADSANTVTNDEIPSLHAMLQKLMNVYDMNGDGFISKEEFFVVHSFLMQFP